MFFSMISNRRKQMVIVDKRVRLLSEVIQSIRAVKLYAYEAFFGDKVMDLRRKELEMLRKNGVNRAFMFSTITFVPTLATVRMSRCKAFPSFHLELTGCAVTFVTYSLSGHDLNPAIIFSGLQYFNIIKTPITFLPLALTATTDAIVGIGELKPGVTPAYPWRSYRQDAPIRRAQARYCNRHILKIRHRRPG